MQKKNTNKHQSCKKDIRHMGTPRWNSSPKPSSAAQQYQMEANAPANHKNGDFFPKFYFKRTEDKEKHPLSTNGKRRLYDIILQECENTQHVEGWDYDSTMKDQPLLC